MATLSVLSLTTLLVFCGITALATNTPSLPTGWSYVGCLYEGRGQRIMTPEFYGRDGMTLSICVQYCGSQNQPYAALEVGSQCFCGNQIDFIQLVNESLCDYPCFGDATQMCGGYGYMTFFTRTSQDPRIAAGLMPTPESSQPVSTSTLQPSTSSEPPTSVAAPSTEAPSSAASQSLSPGSTPSEIFTAISSQSPPPASSTSGPARSNMASSAASSATDSILPAPQWDRESGKPAAPRLRDASEYVVFGTYATSSATPSLYTYSTSLSVLAVLLAVAISI